MSWTELQRIFDRAFYLTFETRKLFFTFCVLALCGLLLIFFQGVAIHTSSLVALSLFFMPVFLCAAVLLSAGILLIRVYHDDIKDKPVVYRELLLRSWQLMVGASYFSMPIILVYLLMWMLLGFFYLLKEIPFLGDFFSVVLIFAPFLLNLGSILLCLLCVGILFFVAPVIALKGINRRLVAQILINRVSNDVFSHIALILTALFPVLVMIGLLSLATGITGGIGFMSQRPVEMQLQWFFLMVPMSALLAPAVVFFFNFAAEAHVIMKREAGS